MTDGCTGRRWALAAWLLAGLAGLSACGQTGPLTLPEALPEANDPSADAASTVEAENRDEDEDER